MGKTHASHQQFLFDLIGQFDRDAARIFPINTIRFSNTAFSTSKRAAKDLSCAGSSGSDCSS